MSFNIQPIRLLWDLARDCRGNVAIIVALALPVLVGTLGMGAEVSGWYLTERSMQNAADSAAIAAATNRGGSYGIEARGVTAQYGLEDGLDDVTVDVEDAATCPDGSNGCYSVTITRIVPLYMLQVVGYRGDTTLEGKPAVSLSVTALADPSVEPHPYCILALSVGVSTGIRTNGAPKANLAGCNIMSNSGSTCNGHDLQADVGDAHMTNNGCGVVKNSNVPRVADPYVGLASNIPNDPCAGSYPQEPGKKGPALPASNRWSGTKNLSGTTFVCGDLQLIGNTTINTASDAVLVIENGQLDTNGFTLRTSNGSGLTVVFSGSSSGVYTHAPTGGGTLDIAAPTSGPWSGVAIYQDPKLTSGVNISAAGNSPTWDITGLVYLPHASVTFSGAVNKSSNGESCFGLVVNEITINGTGSILSHDGCAAAGLVLPEGGPLGRGGLVG